jgi:hypothetical protein
MLNSIKLLLPICNPVCGRVLCLCLCVTVATERVRLQFLMTMNIKLVVRLGVMPYTFVNKFQSFGGTRCVPIQCRRFVYCVTIRVTLLDIQPEHADYLQIQIQSVLLT